MRRTVQTVSVDAGESSAGRFSVRGALTFDTARRASETGRRAFSASGQREIEVDCSAVGAADSAGLAVLLNWLSWAAQSGRRLRLANVPPAIRAVARISEVEDLLDAGAGAA